MSPTLIQRISRTASWGPLAGTVNDIFICGARGKGIAKNIASALAFLHKRRVVHLDVKSANILLTANNVAKLGDLGLSALMKGSFVNTIKGMGSFHWSAPELLMGSHPVS